MVTISVVTGCNRVRMRSHVVLLPTQTEPATPTTRVWSLTVPIRSRIASATGA